jgi:hypothetical protein
MNWCVATRAPVGGTRDGGGVSFLVLVMFARGEGGGEGGGREGCGTKSRSGGWSECGSIDRLLCGRRGDGSSFTYELKQGVTVVVVPRAANACHDDAVIRPNNNSRGTSFPISIRGPSGIRIHPPGRDVVRRS